MKIVCSMVTSADGFIADLKDNTVSADTEWQEFKLLAKKYNNFIIGRKSFDLSPELLAEIDCDYKIVVSSKPVDDYDGLTVVASPARAVAFLEGKAEIGLLVGGSRLNSSFANDGLIDEIVITEKPIALEVGTPFFDSTLKTELDLEQGTTEDLSDGRIRQHYTVKNDH